MLAIVNGGPSELWVQSRSLGVRVSIIIGVKIHGNGVLFSLQTRRWPMAYGRDLFGSYISFLPILCFTFTQLSDGFFLISYRRKARVDLSKHIPRRTHFCCLLLEADCTGGDGDLRSKQAMRVSAFIFSF
jgi:hypothetical protein